MKRLTTVLVIAVSFAFQSANLRASQLWAHREGHYTSIELEEIDSSTGQVLERRASIPTGDPVARDIDDLASDPLRQPSVVWAIRDGNQLVAVDPFRQALLSVTFLNAPATIHNLAIDPTDGAFYGTTIAPTSTTSGALYRIAPDTGITTLVGEMALSVRDALGFDLNGNLYGVSYWPPPYTYRLVSIDKTSGLTSVISPSQLLLGRGDIAVRPEDGIMFGTYGGLLRIDLANGQGTVVGGGLPRGIALAFTNVPEPIAAWVAWPVLCRLLTARWRQFNRRPSATANRWYASGRIESGNRSPG